MSDAQRQANAERMINPQVHDDSGRLVSPLFEYDPADGWRITIEGYDNECGHLTQLPAYLILVEYTLDYQVSGHAIFSADNEKQLRAHINELLDAYPYGGDGDDFSTEIFDLERGVEMEWAVETQLLLTDRSTREGHKSP